MSEEYDPLTEDLIEQLMARRAYRWVHAINQTPKADGLVQDVLCQKSALALQAQAAEIARLRVALKKYSEDEVLLDDREARVVRMRDMLSRASQADNERLRGEVKMHERSASAHAAELAVLRLALENCRTWAALHRKESWALAILRFCSEAGSGPNPLRTPPPTKEQA